jgi:hypothetical protein
MQEENTESLIKVAEQAIGSENALRQGMVVENLCGHEVVKFSTVPQADDYLYEYWKCAGAWGKFSDRIGLFPDDALKCVFLVRFPGHGVYISEYIVDLDWLKSEGKADMLKVFPPVNSTVSLLDSGKYLFFCT